MKRVKDKNSRIFLAKKLANMHVDILIRKALTGKANAKESRELKDWISEAAHNKFEFEDIKLLYQL